MIITIDGPAGSGKSTVAKLVARKLGFTYLNSGAVYRGVTYLAIKNKIAWDDEEKLSQLVKRTKVTFTLTDVKFNGRSLGKKLIHPDIVKNIHYISDSINLRKEINKKLRESCVRHNCVTEGRDQGTVAFPDADIKFYMTASAAERAKRRFKELRSKGLNVRYSSVLKDVRSRDSKDRSRKFGGLRVPLGSYKINTTNTTIDSIVDTIIERISFRRGLKG